LVATRSLFPRLARGEADPIALQTLDRTRFFTDRQQDILALVSPLSLIALAWFGPSNQGLLKPGLLVSLGVFSALAYLVSLAVGPMIHSTLNALIIALSPTQLLLYGAQAKQKT